MEYLLSSTYRWMENAGRAATALVLSPGGSERAELALSPGTPDVDPEPDGHGADVGNLFGHDGQSAIQPADVTLSMMLPALAVSSREDPPIHLP